jgi:hypothetical protein
MPSSDRRTIASKVNDLIRPDEPNRRTWTDAPGSTQRTPRLRPLPRQQPRNEIRENSGRGRVVEALRALPPRLDSKLLLPAARGGFIDGEKFRYREWTPALRAVGIEHRRVYDTRHTFASWAIAGGVQLFYLARIMGRSVQQIDQVYGHLLPDSEEYLRALLHAHDDAVDLAWTQATASSPKSLQNGAMRMRGLEPPRGFPHTDLNRARLPIPPHPRGRQL